jgi:hypothetical protein
MGGWWGGSVTGYRGEANRVCGKCWHTRHTRVPEEIRADPQWGTQPDSESLLQTQVAV